MTRQNQKEEDNLKYSASNYDESQEKKYTIENDVDNNLVKTPKRPNNIDTTQIGRENPARQGFNKQVDFQSPYPENIDSESKIETSYIKPEKKDLEQKRNENSFFQEDPREQKKKYRTR